VAENKTKQNDLSVSAYVDAIADEQRRLDCVALVEPMQVASNHPPRMWGTGIVGFGSYHYKHGSGREGHAPLAAFSSRKTEITVYLTYSCYSERGELFARLGKHKAGKACLYLKRLSDIQLPVLAELVEYAIADVKRRYS
jgi:hypothetical protein